MIITLREICTLNPFLCGVALFCVTLLVFAFIIGASRLNDHDDDSI